MLGLRLYFTDKPCPRGHVDWRRLKNGVCLGCRRVWNNAIGTPRRQERGYWKKWHADNRDEISARARRYYVNNFESAAIRVHHHYVSRKRAEGTFSQGDVDRLFLEQSGLCAGCDRPFGANLKYTIDHIAPLSRGGTNWPNNIQLMCSRCNDSKGARTMEEWK